MIQAKFDGLFSTEERDSWFSLGSKVILHNSDLASPGSHVIIKKTSPVGATYVGIIKEIVQRTGSAAASRHAPDAILVEDCNTTAHSASYNMPLIQPSRVLRIITSMKVSCDYLTCYGQLLT